MKNGDISLAVQALRRAMDKEPPFSSRRKRLLEIIEELKEES